MRPLKTTQIVKLQLRNHFNISTGCTNTSSKCKMEPAICNKANVKFIQLTQSIYRAFMLQFAVLQFDTYIHKQIYKSIFCKTVCTFIYLYRVNNVRKSLIIDNKKCGLRLLRLALGDNYYVKII